MCVCMYISDRLFNSIMIYSTLFSLIFIEFFPSYLVAIFLCVSRVDLVDEDLFVNFLKNNYEL